MRRALPLSALAVVKSSSLTASVSSIVVPPSELPLTQYIIPGTIYFSRVPYGVPCEILDGQWILNQLYEQDYHLAVEFLGCAPEADPNLMDMFRRLSGLQEGGLSE